MMFASLDLFLKAVDMFIQLLSLRSESSRRLFKEVVQPLFQALEPVVIDYISFFHRARSVVSTASPDHIRATLNELSAYREQNLIARRKVQALATELAKERNTQIVDFAKSIQSIFGATQQTLFRMSEQRHSIELLEQVLTGQLDTATALNNLDKVIEQIEYYWEETVTRYQSLASSANR
jgi:hypothetical protein